MEPQARRIAVAARLRPALGAEQGQQAAWAVESENAVVADARTGDAWYFDHAFGPETDSGRLYSACCAEVVEAFCKGINGAVLAYGQTAAGKTHTMHGPGGIVERAVQSVLAAIGADASERGAKLTVSFLEIYNEQVNDLLGDREVNVLEGPRSGLVLQNLSSVPVCNLGEVLACVVQGESKRRVGETAANVRSSRSHALLLLGLESRAEGEDGTRCSQLILADLAGSEGLRHSESTSREQRREGGCINRSLLALTQVIQALSEGGLRSQRANFRDSKLTRILRPSLGGNTQTVLVCALSPSAANRHETRSTLEFASRARCVENNFCVNIRRDAELPRADPQYQALHRELRELRSRVAELQGAGRSGDGGPVADLAQENRVLRMKTEALQAMLRAYCHEDMLAMEDAPCRHRRFSLPGLQDPEASPGPSPTRLRQPGWRSRQPLRSEGALLGPRSSAEPAGPPRASPPGQEAGRRWLQAGGPQRRGEEAWSRASCAEDAPRSTAGFVEAGRECSAGGAPARDGGRPAVPVSPLGSWEFPLTRAEKHARLIHLFTQELCAVQSEQEASRCLLEPPCEEGDEQDEEHEPHGAKDQEPPATTPSPVRQRLPRLEADLVRRQASSHHTGVARYLLKHEGCGLCAVQ